MQNKTNMKTLLIISIFIAALRFSFSQETTNHLYDLQYESFSIADGFVKNCSLKKYIFNDTLTIEIFSQFDCHQLMGWVHFEKDTLKLSCSNDFIVKNERSFDPETGNIAISMELQKPAYSGRCGFIIKFKTSADFLNYPILFNNELIAECEDETQYELLNNDTINRIDKFGMRQGAWMKFHETGNLASLDSFKNDKLVIGYEFNKKGKTIARTSPGGTQSIRIISDTTFFKELPYAPDISRNK